MASRPALSVPSALGHLRVAMQDAFLRASRKHGLTPSQAELLCAAMAPAPVNRLAQSLRCDRTNITHMVSRAVDRGWVHRQTDQRDRRSSLIVLTPEGSRLAESFIATLEHQLADLLATWSPQRRQTAVRLITEIAETLDQAAPHRVSENPRQPQKLTAPHLKELAMAMTVITHHVLRDETAAKEWDDAMNDRLSAARSQPGWLGGQFLRATNDRLLRTIVGTWESREAWESWHGEDAFRETRERLDGLQSRPSETTWYEVIEERHGK